MKPRRSSVRRRPSTSQMLLTLEAARISALGADERAGVIAVLARLLLEAARLPRDREGPDDVP